MFHIFKKNIHYDLSRIRVDMHSHLLPGIDDGCPDTEASLHLIRGLQDLGYERLYMTPHILPGVHPNNSNTISAAYTVLMDALPDELKSSMSFGTAAEFMIDLEFDTGATIPGNCMLPRNKILIEMSYLSASPNIDDVIYKLQINGYQPILAHPERYPYYYQDKGHIEKFKDQGCLIQCNLLSFAGYYGKAVRKAAMDIADQGLIDYLGTDMHHDRHLQALHAYYTLHDVSILFKKNQILNSELN